MILQCKITGHPRTGVPTGNLQILIYRAASLREWVMSVSGSLLIVRKMAAGTAGQILIYSAVTIPGDGHGWRGLLMVVKNWQLILLAKFLFIGLFCGNREK